MSAPYLWVTGLLCWAELTPSRYTPQDNSALAALGYRRLAPYAPPGQTPRRTAFLPHPGHYPVSGNGPIIPPDYDDDDGSDKIDDRNAFYTRGPPGPNNIYPKPDYWRPTYPNKPRSCLLRHFFTTKLDLDPLLRYKKHAHPVRFDLRLSPSVDPQFYLPTFHRVPTRPDLHSLATRSDRSPHELHLWHRLLPWYITIVPRINPRGITVRDVLEELYLELSRPITLYDYWTYDVSDAERERIDQACRARAWVNRLRIDQPICRIDYLQQQYVFLGLVPSSDGTFKIKTAAAADVTDPVVP